MIFKSEKKLLLIIMLNFACIGGAWSAVQWPPAPEVKSRIDAARSMLTELIEVMPADTSDPEALADTLDYEIEVAHQFVRDQVRFEPYVGVLKGAQGTAATLAGNVWDQAILLANLINIMGGEAQLVTGSLDSASAALLLRRAFSGNRQNEGTADTSVLIPVLARYNRELASLFKQHLEASSGEGLKELDADTRRLSGLLIELLGVSAEPGSDPDSLRRLLNELASSYAWVRWRDGPSDSWQALHPAFANGQVPVTTETGVMTSSIPEEMQHRLTLSMQIERQVSGGKIEREAIMSTYTRPTAQLFKQDLHIGLGPPPGSPASSRNAAFILPYLNGSLAPGGKAVNALGLTVDAGSALSSGAGELFARLSTRMGSAIGALNGDGDETGSASTSPRLTGVLLLFKLQAPGMEMHTVERRLADYRNGPAAKFPGAFTFNTVVEVDIGASSGTRVAREFIEQQSNVINAMPALMGVARGVLAYEDASSLPEFRVLPEVSWLDADIIGGLMTAVTDDAAGSRPSAFVMARHTTTGGAGQPITYSDIIFNPSMALRRGEKDVVRFDPGSVLEQGVRETLIESKIMRAKGGWSERTPVSVLANIDQLNAHISKAGWSVAAGEMAARDINRGYKLAVTNKPEYWWRVDINSGSTLGMGALGGQELVEGIIALSSVALSTYFFYRSVEGCDETYADDQEMADCCIVGNLALTGVGAAAGGAAGASEAVDVAGGLFRNMWSSAAGYITASLGIEVYSNIAADTISSVPLDMACRAYLDK